MPARGRDLCRELAYLFPWFCREHSPASITAVLSIFFPSDRQATQTFADKRLMGRCTAGPPAAIHSACILRKNVASFITGKRRRPMLTGLWAARVTGHIQLVFGFAQLAHHGDSFPSMAAQYRYLVRRRGATPSSLRKMPAHVWYWLAAAARSPVSA